jgi:hypothetical protein
MLVLTPESGRGKAHLHLSQGRVLRARWDNREEPRNAELVYGLIAGLRGTFDFHPSNVTLDDEIQCSATRLLFEGLRRISQMRGIPDAPRRFIPVKAAIAVLAMAAFVSVVLAAPFFSDPGAPEALRYLPADPPTTIERSEGRSGR